MRLDVPQVLVIHLVFAAVLSLAPGEAKRIAFFGLPASHYVPMLPVAKELADRGHQVSFMCANITWQKIRMRLEPAGVQWVPLSNARSGSGNISVQEIMSIPYPVLPFSIPLFVIGLKRDWTRGLYYEALEYYSSRPEEKPDLFVIEHFGGWMFDLPAQLGVPYIVLSCNVGSDVFLQPSVVPWSAMLSGALVPAAHERAWVDHLYLYAVRHLRNSAMCVMTIVKWSIPRYLEGLPLYTWPFTPLWRAELFIVASVPAMQDALLFPQSLKFFGALEFPGGETISEVAADTRAATLAWLDARRAEGRPVVYVALGSEVELNEEQLRAFFDGLTGQPWALLWSLRPIPAWLTAASAASPDALRVETFVAQAAVLSHKAVRVFVGHGGMNSMIEAMSRGVPMVIVPFFADQPGNAMVLRGQGAAAVVPKYGITGPAMREAAGRVLAEPGFAAAAARIRDQFAAAPGLKAAATAVEAVATGGSKPPPPPVWVDGLLAYGCDFVLINACFAALCYYLLSCCRRRRRQGGGQPAGAKGAGGKLKPS